ncbi:unnamed protein product, partial [Rotaria sp. Silwood2]
MYLFEHFVQHLCQILQRLHKYQLTPVRQLKCRSGIEHIHRSPSANNLTVICPISIERLDDNIVRQSSQLSSTMTINESTRIGEILCSHLPYMADT